MGFSRSQIKKLVAPLSAQNVRTRKEDDTLLTYLEGWHVIKEANRIFGFDGWDRETLLAEQLHVIRRNDLWVASYHAKVRISVTTTHVTTKRDGIGVGHGTDAEQARARDMALKAAETDATKRAFSTFGNQFGLALYDRALAEVEGAIADTRLANDWMLLDHRGNPIGRYSLPSEFCSTYRKALMQTNDAVFVMRLWIVNYSELRRVVHEVPTLKNRSGMHYGEILQKTYLQKLEMLLEKRSDATALPNIPAGQHQTGSRSPDATPTLPDDKALEPALRVEAPPNDPRARSEEPQRDVTAPEVGASNKQSADRDQKAPKGRIDKSALSIGAPPRRRDKNHLRHVASLSCLVCGRKPCQAHHITYAQRRGLGQKVSDEFTVPLCTIHHRQLHDHGNEKTWWVSHAIEPLAIAEQVWRRHFEAGLPGDSSGSQLSESDNVTAQALKTGTKDG